MTAVAITMTSPYLQQHGAAGEAGDAAGLDREFLASELTCECLDIR